AARLGSRHEPLARRLAERGPFGALLALTLARGERRTETLRDLLTDAGAEVGRALAQVVGAAAGPCGFGRRLRGERPRELRMRCLHRLVDYLFYLRHRRGRCCRHRREADAPRSRPELLCLVECVGHLPLSPSAPPSPTGRDSERITIPLRHATVTSAGRTDRAGCRPPAGAQPPPRPPARDTMRATPARSDRPPRRAHRRRRSGGHRARSARGRLNPARPTPCGGRGRRAEPRGAAGPT